MDAGLAGLLGGVIGAAVGAVGATASAWITGRKAEQQAKIQSETQLGQARLQLDAERTRGLRESRKSAYLAFAEGWSQVHGTLAEAAIKLGGIAPSDPPEEREERRQAARRLWNEARALHRHLNRLLHVIYVEGPSRTAGAAPAASSARAVAQAASGALAAAQAATGALASDFSGVMDWLHAIDHGTETPQHGAESERAHGEAYGKLLEFLYASADAVMQDTPDLREP
ncbi:hypothetical protein [Streptomyces siamensis]|uniref:Secreted protein n=1 Tax=Streptomyces siamensis TaxID=1274986 RepID=A0ABP9J171_9ACTN